MLDYVLLTVQASLADNGLSNVSPLRASLVLHGKFLLGEPRRKSWLRSKLSLAKMEHRHLIARIRSTKAVAILGAIIVKTVTVR